MTLLEDLQDQIAKGQVIVIVGAGVSIGATHNKPSASWTGLLDHGVDRCVEVAPGLPAQWAERVHAEIASGDRDDLLSAAEKIATKLAACTIDLPAQGGGHSRYLASSRLADKPKGNGVISDPDCLSVITDQYAQGGQGL